MKITFMGAGSTVFAKNVLGDCMQTEALREAEIALYDIDGERLEESFELISALNKNTNEGRAEIRRYLGVENRKDALRGASFVVNAIQVGGYDPCTIIDFEVPKKYGLRQTIGDTLGIGGIMRPSLNTTMGPIATDTLKQLHADKAFIGVNGVDLQVGLTTQNILECEMKRCIIEASTRSFVLADASKLNAIALGVIGPVSAVDYIVTEATISSRLKAKLEEQGAEVVTVEVADTADA